MTVGVFMVFSIVRRWGILGMVVVALATGLNVKAYAAGDLLSQVKERGTLIVGLEGTYPPFSFQGKDGKLTGFEVDFANALAEHMGVKAKITLTKWDGMLASLESGRIDVAINQVTISEERKKKYDFSIPYTISGIQVLTKKGNEGHFTKPEDLEGKKVGVGLGSNYEQWLRANLKGVDIRTYDDDPTKYQDLRVGRTDAILVDRLAALDLVKKTNDTLAVAGPAFARQESGVALRKNNPELLAAINQAIAEMQKDGTLTKISEKYFGVDVTK
jgi:L-cystine transport system substrate-binding protein